MAYKKVKYLSILALAGIISIGLSACKEEANQSEKAEETTSTQSVAASKEAPAENSENSEKPEVPDTTMSTSDIKSRLESAFPQVMIDKIMDGPADFLYEAHAGSQVIYTSKDGKYLFVGNLLDLENSKAEYPVNYTEMSRKQLRKAVMAELDNNLPVVFAPENPKYTIWVFTDLDCGYCRKFHENIKEMNNLGIAVRYISFPRAGLNSKSYEKAVSVWCASDRKAALTSAKKGEEVPVAKCDTHNIDKQYELGINIGINGTPAIILEDGALIPGYMPPQRLAAFLEQIDKEKQRVTMQEDTGSEVNGEKSDPDNN